MVDQYTTSQISHASGTNHRLDTFPLSPESSSQLPFLFLPPVRQTGYWYHTTSVPHYRISFNPTSPESIRQHDAALVRLHHVGLFLYHPSRFPRNTPMYVFWHLLILVRSRSGAGDPSLSHMRQCSPDFAGMNPAYTMPTLAPLTPRHRHA